MPLRAGVHLAPKNDYVLVVLAAAAALARASAAQVHRGTKHAAGRDGQRAAAAAGVALRVLV